MEKWQPETEQQQLVTF
uniref:Uncharacterized protein n=1 Tax=Anguilla anguilla TaxID=7936 RepID=A0A0E9UJY6_ANGAN